MRGAKLDLQIDFYDAILILTFWFRIFTQNNVSVYKTIRKTNTREMVDTFLFKYNIFNIFIVLMACIQYFHQVDKSFSINLDKVTFLQIFQWLYN